VTSVVGVAPVAAHEGHDDGTYEPCEFPVTVEDATGEEITIEEPPERVTTINPSAAQTMWEIGGKEQVVGLTQFSMYLDGAAEREDVSAEDFGVSVEKVVATEPDLVLAPNASAGQVEPLRDAGLTVYHFREAKTVDDIAEKTTTTGRLTGNCEGAAEANAWMYANVDAVSETTADVEEQPGVLYPLGGGFVAAGDTFIDAVLTLSGADNVAAENYTSYPQLSAETVLQLDPEVLVLQEGMEYIIDEEPYTSTTAGEANASVVVAVQWMNQPAPRSVVEASHSLTAQLHADRYDESSYVAREAISVEPAETATPTATETGETTQSPTEAETETGDSAPGFGAVAALVAALAAALIAVRRR